MTMKCGEAEFKIVLDRLASPGCSVKAAMGGVANERLIFEWLRGSKRGDERFLVHWPDENAAPIFFHDAVAQARRQQIFAFEAQMRSEVTLGIPRVVLDGGRIVYREREDIIRNGDAKADAETLMLLYGQPDIYLRDEHGDRVPLIVHDAAPAHLKIHVLKSLLSVYNPGVNTDATVTIQGGVQFVGSAPRPAEITARPVELAAVDAEFTEAPPEPRQEGTEAMSDRPDVDRLRREGEELAQRGPRHPHPVGLGVPVGRPGPEPEDQDDADRPVHPRAPQRDNRGGLDPRHEPGPGGVKVC